MSDAVVFVLQRDEWRDGRQDASISDELIGVFTTCAGAMVAMHTDSRDRSGADVDRVWIDCSFRDNDIFEINGIRYIDHDDGREFRDLHLGYTMSAMVIDGGITDILPFVPDTLADERADCERSRAWAWAWAQEAAIRAMQAGAV